MSIDVNNGIMSAFASGQMGLQRASQGITEASANIAQRNAQAGSPEELLAGAAEQQLGMTSKLLPPAADNMTNDLISLKINSTNAAASAKVLDVVNDTVGRIIDEFA